MMTRARLIGMLHRAQKALAADAKLDGRPITEALERHRLADEMERALVGERGRRKRVLAAQVERRRRERDAQG
jgi:hypothetical protein